MYDLPSRLADSLAAGRLDVALIPSVEFFRTAGLLDCFGRLRGLPRAGAEREAAFSRAAERSAARGARRGSRTSAALTQILLAEHVRRVGRSGSRCRLVAALETTRCGCGAVDRRSGDCESAADPGVRNRRWSRTQQFRRGLGSGRGVESLDRLAVCVCDVDRAAGCGCRREAAAILAAARDRGVRQSGGDCGGGGGRIGDSTASWRRAICATICISRWGARSERDCGGFMSCAWRMGWRRAGWRSCD